MNTKKITASGFWLLFGLTLAVVGEVFIFKAAGNSATFQDVEFGKILNLLLTLWFVAFLLESFLEILIKTLDIDSDKKANTKSEKIKHFTAIVSFIIGILISFAGVNTLSEFFTIAEKAPEIEEKLFHILDTILTASLIAGGSKGIHELTSFYRNVLQARQLSQDESGDNVSD